MKESLKKGWKYLLGSVLALLGFGGCDKIEDILDIGGGLCMYGQPTAHFKMVGDVKDEAGKAVRGIRVVVAPNPEDQEGWENDTLYTDAAGHFGKDLIKHDWPDDLKRVTVTFEDVDGPENGSYEMKELKRDDLQIQQTKKGDGDWFEGDYTVTANAVLKKKD